MLCRPVPPQRAALTMIALSLSWGCGSAPPDVQALTSCSQDLWTVPDVATTACSCISNSPQPECKSPDCTWVDFLWLRKDGIAVEGGILRSPQRGTFSSFGVTRSSYSIDAGTITIGPPNSLHGILKCTSTDLVTDELAWRRAPSSMSASLASSWDGGAWLSLAWDAGM